MPMKPTRYKPIAGRILISEPTLQDFYFRRSVVLLAEHNDDGSFGLILNKPINVKLSEISKEFPEIEVPIFLGGPVKTDSLFFLHRLGDKVANSMEIMEGLFWGGDIEEIKRMIKNKEVNKSDIRFFVGYSGWSSKQLEKEVKDHSWLVYNTNVEEVISDEAHKLWGEKMRYMGGDYAIWANYPLDVSNN